MAEVYACECGGVAGVGAAGRRRVLGAERRVNYGERLIEILLVLDSLLREVRAARHERHGGFYRDDCALCNEEFAAAAVRASKPLTSPA